MAKTTILLTDYYGGGGGGEATLLQSLQPWVGKYRPKEVKDAAHQEEVVCVLTNTLETANCPHMLFYGPRGTGKTTPALAIAHQLYRPELYKSRVLELNESDDRGINVVRTKIKDFAAVAGLPCPPYKITILDEADSMTEDAQDHRATCIKMCKIQVQATFRRNHSSRILHICNEEGLTLDAEALSTLSSISQGDLCRAITYLQGAARLFGSSISSEDLISVSGAIPQDVTEALYEACKSGDFDLANKEVNNIIAEGYPVSQILAQVVVEVDDLTNERKACMCKSLATADKCLIGGADEYLQLLDVASNTMRALCNMPQEGSYDS